MHVLEIAGAADSDHRIPGDKTHIAEPRRSARLRSLN